MNEDHIQAKTILPLIIQVLLLNLLFRIKNKGNYCIMEGLIHRR